MLPKWVYLLLLTFVVFFVLSSPESAGPQARSFFSWVGDQASAAATFLDGVFANDSGSPGSTTVPTGSENGFTTSMPSLILLEPQPA